MMHLQRAKCQWELQLLVELEEDINMVSYAYISSPFGFKHSKIEFMKE